MAEELSPPQPSPALLQGIPEKVTEKDLRENEYAMGFTETSSGSEEPLLLESPPLALPSPPVPVVIPLEAICAY